jgi:hypothetical protein
VLGLLAFLLLAPAPYTGLTLTDMDSGRVLLSAILGNHEPVTLRWHNSIYDLPVVEEFYAEDGRLVLDRVTFEDPRGVEHAPVTAGAVTELYHTGGPFSASGMDRPYQDIVFRIGEIGDPKLTAQGRTVALKAEVGFGGRVRLRTNRPRLLAVLLAHRGR